MPTVEADVAFGLGKYHDMNQEEVKSRVIQALDAVGMRDYMQVGLCKLNNHKMVYVCFFLLLMFPVLFPETDSNTQWWSKTKSCHRWCVS